MGRISFVRSIFSKAIANTDSSIWTSSPQNSQSHETASAGTKWQKKDTIITPTTTLLNTYNYGQIDHPLQRPHPPANAGSKMSCPNTRPHPSKATPTWSLDLSVLLFFGGVKIGSSLVNSSSKLLMSVLLLCRSEREVSDDKTGKGIQEVKGLQERHTRGKGYTRAKGLTSL